MFGDLSKMEVGELAIRPHPEKLEVSEILEGIESREKVTPINPQLLQVGTTFCYILQLIISYFAITEPETLQMSKVEDGTEISDSRARVHVEEDEIGRVLAETLEREVVHWDVHYIESL
jgi:hypothetical protein